MKLHFSVILWFISLVGFLTGCRAKLETSSSRCSTSTDEIGVVFRSLDSLWSTYAERQHIKIEFYSPSEYSVGSLGNGTSDRLPTTGSPHAAAPFGQTATDVGTFPLAGDCGGGLGAVKSIEISTEKTEDMAAIRATDSVFDQKTATSETLQRERASQARQDNGTVIGLAIVAAVAVLLYLLLKSLIKPFP